MISFANTVPVREPAMPNNTVDAKRFLFRYAFLCKLFHPPINKFRIQAYFVFVPKQDLNAHPLLCQWHRFYHRGLNIRIIIFITHVLHIATIPNAQIALMSRQLHPSLVDGRFFHIR